MRLWNWEKESCRPLAGGCQSFVFLHLLGATPPPLFPSLRKMGIVSSPPCVDKCMGAAAPSRVSARACCFLLAAMFLVVAALVRNCICALINAFFCSIVLCRARFGQPEQAASPSSTLVGARASRSRRNGARRACTAAAATFLRRLSRATLRS